MEFEEAKKKLEETDVYKDWKKEHEDWYIAHGFLMPDENPNWQVGYTDGEKIVTFLLEPIQLVPEQEAYKKPDKKIEKLGEIKLSLEEAKEIFEKIRLEHYSSEQIGKFVIIVQHIEKNMYNVTSLTPTFKTLNVKISMEGKVISHDLQNLMEQSS